jgi:eukaryotic-like serine/threonine-protein kinase
MPLTPGTTLGPYEILAPLGVGGMGEVYRARDTRLGREVALKILPAEVANDPSRRRRFEQEARAVAALNHPNIVAVFDVGEGYIVSELVEGELLRGLKPPLRKTLDIAGQIASGLAAAHAADIVHRDLKPANILLTRDGRVKILDFGLAKLRAHGDPTAAETVTVNTEPGMVMGTVGYMSPEQVRGLEVDHRCDIFAFGLILYELLTGQRAFQGDTSADTMRAILREEAPELPETVPLALRQIVAHCLEKEPGNRFQTARDLAFALATLAQSGSQRIAAPAVARRLPWFRLAGLAAAALALVGIALVAWHGLSTRPQAVWKGVRLGGPEIAMAPHISPDGHTLAFLAMERGLTQVAVMKPDTGNWTILTHKRNAGFATELNWSPDGNGIYFDRIADVPLGVFSVPALGGEEQLVLEDARTPVPLPDGSLLVMRLNAERQTQIYRFWPDSGRLQGFPVEPSLNYGNSGPRVFPDGRQAVVSGDLLGPGRQGTPHVYVLDFVSGQIRRLSNGATDDSITEGLAVSRDGKSVLISRAAGDMTEIVSLPASGRGSPRVLFGSPLLAYSLDTGLDGAIYLDEWDLPLHILRFSPAGGLATRISTLPSQAAGDGTMLLPDGRAVVPTRRAGRTRLMVAEAGKDALPLVNTTEETSTPLTGAGANQVAFAIGPEPHRTLAIASLSNGRVTRRIGFDKGEPQSLASSPDGKTLYCAAAGTIWSIPVEGGEPRKLRAGESVAMGPGGQSLLVEMVESGKTRILEVPLDGSGEKEIPLNGPFHLTGLPIASSSVRNGKLAATLASLDSWFFLPGVVDLATGRMTQIPVDFPGDFRYVGWAPDGNLVAAVIELRSTVWKMQPEGH